MNEEMIKMLEKHNIGYEQQTIHISGTRMKEFCTDISGKWVPIRDVMKLVDRIHELEKEIYGSR